MMLGESIRVAGDWFYLAFVENNGMAFGLEFGGEYGKLFLSLFRIIVVGVMTYFFFQQVKQNKLHKGLVLAFSLILAGAIGNIIDCMFYGSSSTIALHKLLQCFLLKVVMEHSYTAWWWTCSTSLFLIRNCLNGCRYGVENTSSFLVRYSTLPTQPFQQE
jgi:hypothetical protein